jgi:hypothetical protein|eukprot:COSAG01_NODE_14367_length_1463_cov_2.085777_1_plen_351_part_00
MAGSSDGLLDSTTTLSDVTEANPAAAGSSGNNDGGRLQQQAATEDGGLSSGGPATAAASEAASVEREQWGSRLSFLLGAIGSAIGTGNVWRFPYLLFKYGGGGFLIPYFFALFVLGIPLMLLELGLGQSRQKGFVVCMHEIHRGFAGLAWATVLNSLLSCVFYNVIMAWSVLYLVNSFSMPWAEDITDGGLPLGADTPVVLDPVRLHGGVMVDPCDATSAKLQANDVVVAFTCVAELGLGCAEGPAWGIGRRLANHSSSSSSSSSSGNSSNSSLIQGLVHGRVILGDGIVAGHSQAEDYFFVDVLGRSTGIGVTGSLQWKVFFCLALIWLAVYLCTVRETNIAAPMHRVY